MFQLCEAQPDLNGNPFLRADNFYLKTKREQKRLGVEGGKAAIKIISKWLSTQSQIVAQKINFIDIKI